MVRKLLKAVKEPQIILLLLSLFLAIVAINPKIHADGVVVTYVYENSSAHGIIKKGDVIKGVLGIPVKNASQFYEICKRLEEGDIVEINTNRGAFRIEAMNATLGIEVSDRSRSNIRLGLDFTGGSSILIKPIGNITENTILALKDVLNNRINVYGVKETKIRPEEDWLGNKYLRVEVAGEKPDKVIKLVKQLGKFEIKVLNRTVASSEDIRSVGTPGRSREGGYETPFVITPEAARKLRTAYLNAMEKISKPNITMYLDNKPVFSAPAAESLVQSWKAGNDVTDLSVRINSYEEARRIYAILKSGALPSEVAGIEVVEESYIDPVLGSKFLKEVLLVGLVAIAIVASIVFLRYRKFVLLMLIMFTCLSELTIVLGAAAVIHWTLDLPSIAGIIAVVGTGVDAQIVITDETLRRSKRKKVRLSLKRKIKDAMFIIFVAAATTIFAMTPLLKIYYLRGFALTTIIGITVSVLITRPAYAKLLEIFIER